MYLDGHRFNPDYAQYGFGQWPGGAAHNAFNASELSPYTGALPLGDYIEDLQLPHMVELATKYDTEIMVCFPFFPFSFLRREDKWLIGAGAVVRHRRAEQNARVRGAVLQPRAGAGEASDHE
jgi:hypothetical protein